MNRRLVKTGIGVLFAGCVALAATATVGADEHGGHHESDMGHMGSGERTLPGLWQAVKTHEAELNKRVTAKDLGKVHEIAFAIRDLVAAMPEKSGQLSVEQQGKLKGNVKYVATLATRLDESGDANNQSATEANFKQLQAILASIEALYPPEALK